MNRRTPSAREGGGEPAPRSARYVLRLFITGSTKNSASAVESIRHICEENLRGHYELEIIDLYAQPDRAVDEQIIAAPTLVKMEPLPRRRLIGDMSDADKVLHGLDVPAPAVTVPGKTKPRRERSAKGKS